MNTSHHFSTYIHTYIHTYIQYIHTYIHTYTPFLSSPRDPASPILWCQTHSNEVYPEPVSQNTYTCNGQSQNTCTSNGQSQNTCTYNGQNKPSDVYPEPVNQNKSTCNDQNSCTCNGQAKLLSQHIEATTCIECEALTFMRLLGLQLLFHGINLQAGK